MAKYFKNLGLLPFFTFSESLNKSVATNGAAWNIPPGKVTDLNQMFTAYQPYYAAVLNKNTRTRQQVQNHIQQRIIWQDYIEFFANTYLITNGAISDAAIAGLGLNRRSTNYSARPQIKTEVFAKIEALAGSKMQFTCRTNSDSNRPSLAEDADAVEVRYAIGTQPATYNDCPHKEISTKARFTLELNTNDAGKKIYAYLRWRNNAHPHKSGPFTDMLSTMIRS